MAGARTWTYAALDAEATRVARQLWTLGARAGDRVATVLHNGAEPAVLAHALLRVGATLVPLNVRLSAPELAWQVGDAAPRLLIVDARTAELAAAACGSASAVTVVSLADLAAVDAPNEEGIPLRLTHDPAAVLAILYTSGTTGRPKGAMLTVANFWWSAVGSALNLGTHTADRWLAPLPLFHVGGLSIVLRAAIYGIAAVIHDGFDPVAVNAAIDEGVTIVSVVAVMLQRMLDARGDRPYPPSLRCVLLGGGPAPRPLLERAGALGVPVVQSYGLTETTSQIATLAPEDALPRLGAAGRALYPNALRVIGADGNDVPANTPGEIVVRGPVVMAGYAGRPDATARAIVDGWLHTGDVGRLDPDGYLYVLDRRDDLIVSGGENVYPAEVEAALLAHPWVSEAAVIGVADATWGQRVVAIVRLTEKANGTPVDVIAEVLRAHCRACLAGYKLPREVRVASAPLPRTASGKLRRMELRASLARE